MKKDKLILIFLVAILLEVIVFNITSYYTLFGKNQIKEYKKSDYVDYDEEYAIMKISDINCKVHSLKLNLKPIGKNKTAEYIVFFTDEASSGYRMLSSKMYVESSEKSKFIPLYLSGESKELLVYIQKDYYSNYFMSVTLNEKIPFEFNFVRFFIVLGILISIYAIKTDETFMQDYSIDSLNQKRILNLTLCIFIIAVFCINIVSSSEGSKRFTTRSGLYNVSFVNALYNKQSYLMNEPSEKLLELDNPYDLTQRDSSGLERGKDYLWDTAYYKGNQYIYFGILPALLVFLPFYIITKQYLKISVFIFIISVCVLVLLKKIFLKIIDRYFKNIPFKNVFYSLILLYCGSFILYANGSSRFYEVAIISGLFFVLLGIFFIQKSIENIKNRFLNLFFGSLFLALSVACRPIDLLVSIIILPYIFSLFISCLKNDKRSLFKLIISVTIPYIVIGIALMYYNYIRFDNPFEFGTSYQLTLNDMGKVSTGIFTVPTGLVTNLFGIPRFSFTFPFLETNTGNLTFYGYYYIETMFGGLFLLAPICFSVFGIYKANKTCSKELKVIIWTLLVVGILIAIISVVLAGSIERYLIDYAWIFVLDGVIVFNINYNSYNNQETKKILQKILTIIAIYSIIISMLLGVVSETESFRVQSPANYYKLRQSVCFWE